MDQLGGRKWVYTLLVTVLGFSLVLFHYATAQQFFSFIVIIAGMYIGGNLGDQYIASKTPQENKEEPPVG